MAAPDASGTLDVAGGHFSLRDALHPAILAMLPPCVDVGARVTALRPLGPRFGFTLYFGAAPSRHAIDVVNGGDEWHHVGVVRGVSADGIVDRVSIRARTQLDKNFEVVHGARSVHRCEFLIDTARPAAYGWRLTSETTCAMPRAVVAVPAPLVDGLRLRHATDGGVEEEMSVAEAQAAAAVALVESAER